MSEGLFNLDPQVSPECARADHNHCTSPTTCQCGCRHLPARPYVQDGQRSAGWSGTNTSKAGEPARGKRQVQVLGYVRLCGERGATAAEVEEGLGLDHGKVSGPLSVLHRQRGHLALLKEVRGGFRVYVTPDNLAGRDHD